MKKNKWSIKLHFNTGKLLNDKRNTAFANILENDENEIIKRSRTIIKLNHTNTIDMVFVYNNKKLFGLFISFEDKFYKADEIKKISYYNEIENEIIWNI